VIEFRAAVIVGSGSLSFEMIRYLTERLPVMICPKWVSTRIQPIAIRNVLDYLAAALDIPAGTGRILEIGGRDVLTYAEMMMGYARARGLTRRLLAVPVLTPRLSSYWVHLVTPIPANIAQALIKGLGNEVIVRQATALKLFPMIEPLDYVPFVDLMRRAYLVLTDSGGIQEEGPSLGIPIIVMREKTERPEAVDAGTVRLAGTSEERIVAETVRLLNDPSARAAMSRVHNPYGDGHASERIAEATLSFF